MGEMQMRWDDERIQKAMEIAWCYGQDAAAHHKAWAIDQMVRALCGSDDIYKQWIADYTKPLSDDPDDYYEWDVGIIP